MTRRSHPTRTSCCIGASSVGRPTMALIASTNSHVLPALIRRLHEVTVGLKSTVGAFRKQLSEDLVRL